MGVYGNVCCVAAVVKESVFSLGVLKYMVCLCKGCDGCCVFCCIVTRGAVGARVGIGKYECSVMQMLYVCTHPVAVFNAAFCITCSLSRRKEVTILKRHTLEPVS